MSAANRSAGMSEDLGVHDPVAAPVVPEKTLYLAKWSTRFWAWLIDFILVFLFLNIIHSIVSSFIPIPHFWDFTRWNPFNTGLDTFIFFLYWTGLEGYKGRGQSIGK